MAYQTMYAATKAALNGLTLALRYELWDENIRVTSATPGTTVTAIWARRDPSHRAPSRLSSPRGRSSRAWRKTSGWFSATPPTSSAAKNCFDPDAAQEMDDYFLNVARKRRSGEWVV